MNSVLLLLAVLALPVLQEESPPADDPKTEYASLLEAAGEDVEKLWEVVSFCEANGLDDEHLATLRIIVDRDPRDVRAHEKLGYVRQDLVWVAPDEIPNIGKQLFKCGDQWLPLEKANEYHAELEKWWRIPSREGHFVVYATTDRWVAEEALTWMEKVFNDLVRLYGRAPEDPVVVVVLRNLPQYNEFASGDQSSGKIGTEASGYSSLYGAYQVETWFDQTAEEFPRAGVAYWDISTWADHAWGKMHLRHATGLAFAERLDPSRETERSFVRSLRDPSRFDPQQFWREKKVPMWIRFGGASYAERFFFDADAEREGGDPRELRKWTINETIKTLDPLEQIFRFDVSPNDRDRAQKLMAQAGLLVAFVLDGDCTPVETAHAGFKAALKRGEGVDKAVEALQKAISEHEPELFAFADLPPRAAGETKASGAAAPAGSGESDTAGSSESGESEAEPRADSGGGEDAARSDAVHGEDEARSDAERGDDAARGDSGADGEDPRGAGGEPPPRTEGDEGGSWASATSRGTPSTLLR